MTEANFWSLLGDLRLHHQPMIYDKNVTGTVNLLISVRSAH